MGCHSFAPFGAYPCCIQFPGRCPGLAYQCPIRGVNLPQYLSDTHPRPLPKEGELTPTPLFMTEGQKNMILPPFGRVGVGFHHPFGRAGVGSHSSFRKGYGFLLMQANKVRAGELCSGNRRSRFACRRMEPGRVSPKLWLPRCIAWLTAQKAKQVVLVCNKGLIAMQ